jgi:hypothetical protein
MKHLRQFIIETIQANDALCKKFNGHRGYFEIDANNPFSIEDVRDAWVNCGLRAYEYDAYHAIYSPEELWPYREYEWSRDSAGDEDSIDKWQHIPDEGGNTGTDKWDAMVEKMRGSGWKTSNPAHVELGKNGIIKVGEGNHRLAIALELGIPVPVMFHFKERVAFDPSSNVS